MDKDKIKEKLFLYQLKNDYIFPSFISEDKNQIKKHFQNSFKNCKKIRKINFSTRDLSKDFAEKLEIYFDMRTELTDILLKEFKNHGFDEAAAYREIFNIDPIFGEMLECLFEEKIDLDEIFEGIEEKYKSSYLEKIQSLEKKTTKRQEKKRQIENSVKNLNEGEKVAKIGKEADKIAKNKQKIEKKQEIVKTKEEFKKSKFERKDKEK